MRIAVVLFALCAASAQAQSPFAPNPGAYVSVLEADAIPFGDGDVGLDAEAGWRFGNGIDVNARFGVGRRDFDRAYDAEGFGTSRKAVVGLGAGYTRWLSDRAGVRLSASGLLRRTEASDAPQNRRLTGEVVGTEAYSRGTNEGEVDLLVTAFRRVPVWRSVRIQPGIGLYAGWETRTENDVDGPFSLRADTGTVRAEGGSGIEVSLPVLFRLGGLDLTFDYRGRIDLTGRTSGVSPRLRANF